MFLWGLIDLAPAWRRNVAIGLALFSGLGLFAVEDVIHWKVLLILGGALLLALLTLLSEFVDAFTQVIGAVAVPWLSLFGFNLFLHKLPGSDTRPGLIAGLVLAGVVFTIAATGYLLAWREHTLAAPFVAIVLAGANVMGVPLLTGLFRHNAPVAAPQPIVSQLDAAIVVPAEVTPLPAARPLPDLDVRYFVGRAGSNGVDWLQGAPVWRDRADQLVLLDVDGTPATITDPSKLPSVRGSPGEVTRWLGIAHRIRPEASVAVLLRTTDRQRIDKWTRAVGGNGSVASVQKLRATTLADAAVSLSADAPDAAEDLTLALRFRPVLLFDTGETLHTPLEIDDFLKSGRVQLCHEDKVKGGHCDKVARASDLVNGATHLKIAPRAAGAGEPATAIYVHPVNATEDGQHLLLLDYWWYLDGNPAPQARGISCGIGLALPGITCFNHPSDWEGMTVVLNTSGPEPVPVAIQYAEHNAVVRYPYDQLRRYWTDREERDPRWRSPLFRSNLKAIDDLDKRPLAFIARGSHAAYAAPCPPRCGQLAADLPDGQRDGLVSWPQNVTARCAHDGCQRLLPTRLRGHEPALWNAYQGFWGDRECILHGTYCTAEQAPGAPATQGRYKHPLHITGYVDPGWRFHRCGGDHAACPALPPPGS